jgi:hypothetical protein
VGLARRVRNGSSSAGSFRVGAAALGMSGSFRCIFLSLVWEGEDGLCPDLYFIVVLVQLTKNRLVLDVKSGIDFCGFLVRNSGGALPLFESGELEFRMWDPSTTARSISQNQDVNHNLRDVEVNSDASRPSDSE